MLRNYGLLLLLSSSLQAADTGPWNLDELRKPPKVEWIDKEGPVRSLYYEGESYQGKPTRVFAWYAEPAKVDGKLPAMVLVHGGGGTAFKEWAELWAKRGYVAIAMDLAGVGADKKRLPDGGPGQGDETKFAKEKTPLKEMWTYHAVANVIRANSLLRSLQQVDPDRIGLTGISWGGYLSCIVAGLDNRFKVAVPVYGCGFLGDNSAWVNRIKMLPDGWREEWLKNFDPSVHVQNAKMPMLFVNGTNDFAYPLDSYQKTYQLVNDRNLCIKVNMPHGHTQGWAPVEIGLFVDQIVSKGKPLYRFDRPASYVNEKDGETAIRFAAFPNVGETAIDTVQLHWTTDLKEPWQKRKWQSVPLNKMIGNATDFFSINMPKERPIVYFLTATDGRKATVSTEHALLEK